MAEFVGAFAASHAPLIARDWDKLSATSREIITNDFRELGRRLTAAVDADDDKGQLVAGSRELGDGLEGDVVGPLQVLEHKNRLAARGPELE